MINVQLLHLVLKLIFKKTMTNFLPRNIITQFYGHFESVNAILSNGYMNGW